LVAKTPEKKIELEPSGQLDQELARNDVTDEHLNVTAPRRVASLLDIQDWYVQNNFTRARFPVERLADNSYVDQANQKLGPFVLENKDSKLAGPVITPSAREGPDHAHAHSAWRARGRRRRHPAAARAHRAHRHGARPVGDPDDRDREGLL
jgi:hypothetical protein